MKREPSGQEFTDRLKGLLDADAKGMDEPTAARLRSARRRAVAELDRPHWIAGWLPAGGLATAALAVLVLLMWQGNGVSPVPDMPAGDWEILAVGELELLEDLHFYDWLADADTAG